VSLAGQAVVSGSIVGGARAPSNAPLGVPAFSLPATTEDHFPFPVAHSGPALLPRSGVPGTLPAASLDRGDGGVALWAALRNDSGAPSPLGSEDGTPALLSTAASTRVDTALLDLLFERIGDDSFRNWQLDLPEEEFGSLMTGFPNGVPAEVPSDS